MAQAEKRRTSDMMSNGPLTGLRLVAEVDTGVDLLNTQVSMELTSTLTGQTVEDVLLAVRLLERLLERHPGPGTLAQADEVRRFIEGRPNKRESRKPPSISKDEVAPFGPRAELVPMTNGEDGKPILLRPMMVLGRSRVCDISVPSAKVSRQHSKLTAEGDVYVIEDLGSANFTWVNGERVERPHRLTDGDVISVGDVSLRYRLLS